MQHRYVHKTTELHISKTNITKYIIKTNTIKYIKINSITKTQNDKHRYVYKVNIVNPSSPSSPVLSPLPSPCPFPST